MVSGEDREEDRGDNGQWTVKRIEKKTRDSEEGREEKDRGQ